MFICRPSVCHHTWHSTRICQSRARSSFYSTSIKTIRREMNSTSELFNYTSGRWLYNEHLRLSERRLVFNVNELKRIAAGCLSQPVSEIKDFFKLGEGGFNRVFQVTMNNGTEILARLPYLSTEPRRLTVASEVATLDLVRAAGIPVPRILQYSIDSGNSVGAEYIIMEKLPGRPLGDRWLTLSAKQRRKILTEIVKMEVKLFGIELPAYGSVYYEQDLPESMPRVAMAEQTRLRNLCIGPYVDLAWWYRERASMILDRGPYKSPLQVLSSVADKELKWLKSFGKPRLPFKRVHRESLNYQKSDPLEHIATLEQYLLLTPFLLPHGEKYHRATLRHPDLNPNNIMVTDNLDIVGFIDWQHTSVLPGFLAAGVPDSFQNYSDEDSMRCLAPRRPDNLNEMGDEEAATEMERFRRRHIHFSYLELTQRLNEPHSAMLDRPTELLTRRIFDHVSAPWEGNNIPLKADLILAIQIWPRLMGDNGYDGNHLPVCPVSFEKNDSQQTLHAINQQEESDAALVAVNDLVGITSDGWILNEDYEGTVARAQFLKHQAIEDAETEEEKEICLKHWPLDDFDEDE